MSLTSILPRGLSKRDAVLEEAAADEHAAGEDVARLERELTERKARAEHLRASADEAAMACFTLEAQVRATRAALDVRRARRERQLLELADPRINAFLDWLEEQRAGLHHRIREQRGLGPRNPKTFQRPETYGSNLDAIQALSTALGEARLRAEALKLQRYDDLDAALAQIRADIPRLEDLERELGT